MPSNVWRHKLIFEKSQQCIYIEDKTSKKANTFSLSICLKQFTHMDAKMYVYIELGPILLYSLENVCSA